MSDLKIVLCAVVLFTLLGPQVGLLASGVFPFFAWVAGGIPAALCGVLMGLMRLALAGWIRDWQASWPAWLLLFVGGVVGAMSGAFAMLAYALATHDYIGSLEMSMYLGAAAGGVCNALFWRMRFSGCR